MTGRTVLNQCRLNVDIPKANQVSFGNNSIRSFGLKSWNSVPSGIMSYENLETFKRIIKNCDSFTCNCRVCKKLAIWSIASKIYRSSINVQIIYNSFFQIIVVPI